MKIPLTFFWPQFLWLLLIVPLLLLVYFWLLRRKKKTAVRYASLAIVREAMAGGSQWRRHVPPVLFLLALTAMLLAAARPFATLSLPSIVPSINVPPPRKNMSNGDQKFHKPISVRDKAVCSGYSGPSAEANKIAAEIWQFSGSDSNTRTVMAPPPECPIMCTGRPGYSC